MRAHPAGPRHEDVVGGPEAPPRPGSAAELNALDPTIWPETAARDARSGALVVGGCDIRGLVSEIGSPVYVLDEADFASRARAFHDAFAADAAGGRPTVFYAAKAFMCAAVARWVVAAGLGIDVSTGGELVCALRAGVPASHLIVHGNNKSLAEVRAAVGAEVSCIVIDSFEDVAKVAFAASEVGRVQPVMIRATVGVEAHTHEFIATAHEDQKFGFSIASGDAMEAARRVVASRELELIGLHSHIGSQIFVAEGFELAATRMVALMARIRRELNVIVQRLDLGGGIGIKYVAHDQPPDLEQLAKEIREWVRTDCDRADLPVPALDFEPGRAIVGPAVVTAYTVGTVKPIELDGGGVRTYVSVDGGMSDNIRAALYGADYTVVLASRLSDAPPTLCRVVGKHCETGDVVVRDCWLPSDIAVGDVLAVAATGAYCRAMASNYNLVPRPPVVGVRGGRFEILVRRETVEDVLGLDMGLAASLDDPRPDQA